MATSGAASPIQPSTTYALSPATGVTLPTGVTAGLPVQVTTVTGGPVSVTPGVTVSALKTTSPAAIVSTVGTHALPISHGGTAPSSYGYAATGTPPSVLQVGTSYQGHYGHSSTPSASQPGQRQWCQPMFGSAAGSRQVPLTAAMNPSSMLDPADDIVIKGIILRPEYHVQHVIGDIPVKNISHKNMSYPDLVLGMCGVAKYLLQLGGDIDPYLSHMSFIARQAYLDCFTDATFVEYDRVVTDAIIHGDIPTYIPGYPLAQALAFHSANHKTQYGKPKGRWIQPKRAKSNIANEVCYNYNFRSCEGCERLHVCKQCRGNHKHANCPTKDKQQQ